MITLTNTNQPLTPDTLASIPTARAYTTIRADALIATIRQLAVEWDAEGRLGQTCVTPAQMIRDFATLLEALGIENATTLIMGYQLDQKITITPKGKALLARRKKSGSNNTPPASRYDAPDTIMHCNDRQGLGG